ncbi:MAG: elongation factor Ts [Clostridia bacterium]|nr:elongation factor Ts [Clostridia bacterium]
MAITAKDVNDLRQKTGIGMMECKKALTEANGDPEEAIKILREKGLAVAAKKSSRIAAEGVVDVAISEDGKTAAIIEVNIETDFAAKNETFQKFVRDLLAILLAKKPANMEEFLALDFDGTVTVEGAVKDKVFTIGENINIRRFELITGKLNAYVHGKGQMGVVVVCDCDDSAFGTEKFKEVSKNVALQICAMAPLYVTKEDVPAAIIEEEKAIITSTIKNDPKNANKPANIIEKMVEGKASKYYDTNCLLCQDYVKDDSMKVEKYLASEKDALGSEIKIVSFVRWEKGEGLEKKEEDFAAEIEKLTKK